jgi:2-iminoacetate synthase ThiH
MDRAQEAGVDDNGMGVLFGLYDWRFEVMGLLYHTIHLEEPLTASAAYDFLPPYNTRHRHAVFAQSPICRQRQRFQEAGCNTALVCSLYRTYMHRQGI